MVIHLGEAKSGANCFGILGKVASPARLAVSPSWAAQSASA